MTAFPYSQNACQHLVAQFAPTEDRTRMEARCFTCGKTADVAMLGEEDVDRAARDVLAALRGRLPVN